jgi:cation diffusion facilitator CzcD-associated flavoprotein CzcO
LSAEERGRFRVIVIGAGMNGLTTAVNLERAGIEYTVIDRNDGVGGTWHANVYPGARVDFTSRAYSYTWEPDWPWKHYFATQDELKAYFEHIVDKYDIRRHFRLSTEATQAVWNEQRQQWEVKVSDRSSGAVETLTANVVISAIGIFSRPKIPVIPGMEDFTGAAFHTARWDYGYTGGSQEDPRMTGLADKVVAVIGTGASAIQAIPPLAESSKHLYVFQRTPAAVGVRGDRPTDADFATTLHPGWHRERNENFQAVMLGQPVETDLVDDGWSHHFARINNYPFDPATTMEEHMLRVDAFDYEVMELHRQRIRETITDPARADLLMPYYKYSCRRPLFHDAYLPSLNRGNVTVVDCPVGIDRITEHGVVVDGNEFEVDCIVYATGFEPEVTPFPRRAAHDIVGRGGRTAAEKWDGGGATLFGLMTSGFPNMFLMPCPGQQAVVTVNYTLLAEVGAEFVAATIAALDAEGVASFDVTEAAEGDWVQGVVADSMAAAPPAGGVPCTPGSRMLFDDDGRMVLLDPQAGTYGGGFGDYFGYRDLLAEWTARGDFAGLALERRSPGGREV